MARLFPLKPMVLALSLGFSTLSTALAEDGSRLGNTCPVCDNTPAANPKPTPMRTSGEAPLPTDYTRITADQIEGQTGTGARAEGDVIIERNSQVLNAQWVEYNQQHDTIKAGDTFQLQHNDTIVSGDTIEYNLSEQTGTATNAHLTTEHEGRRLQSVGSSVALKGKGRYEIRDAEFNTCRPGDASWYIRAKSIEANENTGIGVAKHAALVFGGIPILYTPWADFPLNGNRKSGFLVPTLKGGSDGVEIATPYYLNLAPNYDATITPRIISARGAEIGGELRYLEPTYQGSISGRYMPHDRRSQYNNRYLAQWHHDQIFNANWSGGVRFNQVSDHDYYRDFFGRNDIASNVNLNRQIWLNHHTQLLGGRLDSYATIQKYQTLANSFGYTDRPYALMPRISSRWQRTIGNAQLNAFTQFTHFAHNEKQAGNRLVVYPSAKWDFHNNWGYIRPKIGVHATYYDLNAFEGAPARHTSRILPIANIDAGMTFERRTQLFGLNTLQTLEPRLFYNYIPTKQQNNLPNFDSAENSFNYNQLFRENLYSGNDRINAAHSLTTAIQTRILDAQTGAERFRAGIGQKFYLRKDNVLLDGSISSETRNRSDWVAFGHGRISNNIYLDTNLHYNQNQRHIQNLAAGLRYQPAEGKVLSARYKYGRNEPIYLKNNGEYYYDELRQIDIAAQWPITRNLYAVGRLNYALNVKKPLEQLIGLEYRSNCGCWSSSIVAQRYVTGLNQSKNAVFFNLQLKDLSNIGNNPFEQLRLAIPGYRKTNEVNTQ